MDNKLFGKVDNSPDDELHDLSLSVQSFGKALQALYDDAGGKELDALDVLKASVQQLQNAVSDARTKVLKGLTVDVKTATEKLAEQRKRLDSIVKVVNGVNEILEIATQVAQIAAGLAV